MIQMITQLSHALEFHLVSFLLTVNMKKNHFRIPKTRILGYFEGESSTVCHLYIPNHGEYAHLAYTCHCPSYSASAYGLCLNTIGLRPTKSDFFGVFWCTDQNEFRTVCHLYKFDIPRYACVGLNFVSE